MNNGSSKDARERSATVAGTDNENDHRDDWWMEATTLPQAIREVFQRLSRAIIEAGEQAHLPTVRGEKRRMLLADAKRLDAAGKELYRALPVLARLEAMLREVPFC